MKRKPKYSNLALMFVVLISALGFFPRTVIAGTSSLVPGDVAVILMNTDNPDAVAFVALADLPAGEEIIFTDSGWYAAGGFRATEGAVRYTVPSGGVTAGTIVYREDPFAADGWDIPSGLGFSGGFYLSSSGDQVIVFQGDTTTHSLVFAVNGEGAAVWQADATSSNTSALPSGLTDGTTAVAVSEADNIRLNCAENHTGTKEELLAYISDSTNWVGNSSTRQSVDPSCSFTVTGGGPLQPKINEFSADTSPGDDVEFIEIYGEPETDYSAYTVLEIEAGASSAYGVIDEVIPIGTTDASGFFLQSLAANTLENDSITLLLVKDFSGSFGEDIDTDDDGVIDYAPWSEVTDSVAVRDDPGHMAYGLPILYPYYDGLNYAPGGASRIPDGYDTETDTDWVRNQFYYLDEPDPGVAFNTPGAPNAVQGCSGPYTPIYDIQGSGMSTPYDGLDVVTEGIVVGDFQEGGKNGFFIQDATGDGDPNTSDGVFVYYPGGSDVSVGDHVRLQGEPSEYYDATQIGWIDWLEVCAVGEPLPAPAVLSLPVDNVNDLEAYEGMLVTFPQDLVIAEYYDYDRFGTIVLTSQRYLQFTALSEPNVAGYAESMDKYAVNSITLDDGSTYQNPDPARHPNGLEFDLYNLFRGGELLTNVTGIMDYGRSISYYDDVYRIQPTQGADYTPTNPRTTAPDIIEGDIKVASLNVYNYFTTLDDGPDICGPSGDMECRGADNAEELERQRAKIISALSIIDADIVGLMEIENDRPGPAPDYAAADLVAGLNDLMGLGTYDYIATGAIGDDAIKVAMIYKPGNVTPVGSFAVLDDSVDPLFLDDYNRPVLAQTFMDNIVGDAVTVAVNHLKSKGSPCDAIGDPDLSDGQGNCNLTRSYGAASEVLWLDGDPTGSGAENILIIGDLNAYDKEDPIDRIKAGADNGPGTDDDYMDMIHEILGEAAYSYLFDGKIGYLDYALANLPLAEHVSDVTIWHINADEADLINYDTSYKQDAQDAIYAPDEYRASDHDPVIITLTFNKPPFADDDYYQMKQDDTLDVETLHGVLENDYDLNEHDIITLDVVVEPMHGTVELNHDGSFTYIPDALYFGEDSFEYLLMANPPERGEFSDTATVYITIDSKYKYYFPIGYGD